MFSVDLPSDCEDSDSVDVIDTCVFSVDLPSDSPSAPWLTKTCYRGGITVLHNSINYTCLLYTSPSPRDATLSRMPSSA